MLDFIIRAQLNPHKKYMCRILTYYQNKLLQPTDPSTRGINSWHTVTVFELPSQKAPIG